MFFKNWISYFLVLVLGAGIFECSDNSNVAGGGSELPNTLIAGRLINSEQNEVAFAKVYLRKIEFDASGPKVTLEKVSETNAQGRFELTRMKYGKYALYSNNESQRTSAYISNILVENKDSLDLGDISLKSSILLQGVLEVPSYMSVNSMSLFIPGTGLQTKVGTDGVYQLPNAPQGTYELHFQSGNVLNVAQVSVITTGIITTDQDQISLASFQFSIFETEESVPYELPGAEVTSLAIVPSVSNEKNTISSEEVMSSDNSVDEKSSSSAAGNVNDLLSSSYFSDTLDYSQSSSSNAMDVEVSYAQYDPITDSFIDWEKNINSDSDYEVVNPEIVVALIEYGLDGLRVLPDGTTKDKLFVINSEFKKSSEFSEIEKLLVSAQQYTRLILQLNEHNEVLDLYFAHELGI